MKGSNEDLLEGILSAGNLNAAWRAVKANAGCGGVDGIAVEDFPERFAPHRQTVLGKLRAGSYKPSPALRKWIPKGSGGRRPLGIPTVQDRLIQQALRQGLEPLFEPGFSEGSYGYRPGRSALDAVKACQSYAKSGKDWVADIDLKSFFDEVDHDILMARIAERVSDKRVLRLIGRFLRSGIVEEGSRRPTLKGVPQGSPLSPLLSNIYLDALDKELERRGLSFARYADDCVIHVGSRKAAERVYASVAEWIERRLKLPVNREKSDTGRPWTRPFLGYRLDESLKLEPSARSLERLRSGVRARLSPLQPLGSSELRDRWLGYMRGWCAYFSGSETIRWRRRLSGWMRRHMRKCFWQRWHGAGGRRRRLRQLGVSEARIRRTPLHANAWRTSTHPSLNAALSNATLRRYGFLTPDDLLA